MKGVLKVTLRSPPRVLLAGCSAVRLAYDNADTYLLWRAKSYLDLDAKGRTSSTSASTSSSPGTAQNRAAEIRANRRRRQRNG